MIRSRRRVAIVLNCDSGTLYGKGMVFQRLCGVGKTNNNVALIAYTRKLPTTFKTMLTHRTRWWKGPPEHAGQSRQLLTAFLIQGC
jgi:hypothetical protein